MKNRLIILAIATIGLGYGCGKLNDTTPTYSLPVGSFTGKFTRLHKKAGTGAVDTSIAIVTITTNAKNLFKVSGDTSKVHAGSHGGFYINAAYMQFVDSTATVYNIPKTHLNGTYQYYYDGTSFQLTASNDTIGVLYDLKKN